MIEKNAPPRNYQFRLQVPSSTSVGDYVVEDIGIAIYTYGKAFSDFAGIKLTVTNTSDNPTSIGDSSSYNWELLTPWGDFSDTETGNNNADFVIEIDNCTLTGSCDSWRLQFSELRLVNGGDTLATIAAVDDSGDGYDARQNLDVWESHCLFFPEVITDFSECALTESGLEDQDFEFKRECKIGSGFRYNEDGVTWIYPEINIINRNPITDVCLDECDPTWDAVNQDNSIGQGCWDIEVTSRYEFFQDHVLYRTDHCHCKNPPQTEFDRRIYQISRHLNEKRNAVWVHRKDGPIRDYRTVLTTTCDPLVIEGDDVTTSTNHTVCLTQPFTSQQTYVTYCLFYDLVPCTPDDDAEPGDPPPVICPGELPDNYYCKVIATAVMSWPEPVICGKALDYAVSRSQKHAWAIADGDQLVIKQNDNNFNIWRTYDVGDAPDVVKIAWDSSSSLDRLWLLTITGGVLELRHSLDSLDNWSSVVATWSADMADLAWSGNNLLYNYFIDGGDLKAKVFDAQMNLVRDLTTNVSSIDSDSYLGMDLSIKDGKQRVTVTYTSGGVPTVKSSFDHTNFT